jgi:hypothetical protein
MRGTATHRPISFALSLGLLGGAALIITAWNTTRGPAILLPYAALIVIAGAYLRGERVQGFGHRAALTFGSFMAATVILYLFVGLVAAKTLLVIPIWGHAWRLGLMAAIGAALSAAVAQLTATDRRAGLGFA